MLGGHFVQFRFFTLDINHMGKLLSPLVANRSYTYFLRRMYYGSLFYGIVSILRNYHVMVIIVIILQRSRKKREINNTDRDKYISLCQFYVYVHTCICTLNTWKINSDITITISLLVSYWIHHNVPISIDASLFERFWYGYYF